MVEELNSDLSGLKGQFLKLVVMWSEQELEAALISVLRYQIEQHIVRARVLGHKTFYSHSASLQVQKA